MKVLVTGAHGFIGSHLTRLLLEEGCAVRALVSPWGRPDNLRSVLENPRLELVRADVTEPHTLTGSCRDVEVVFHAAARVAEWGPWGPFERVNVRGTENLLREAERARVRRFVLVSSVAVHRYTGFRHADPRALPLDGDVNAYARSKALAEALVMRAGGLEPVAVRPGLLPFGARDPNLARQVAALRWGGVPLVGGGRAVFNTAYVGDLARGLLLAGTVGAAAGRVYVIGDAGMTSWRDWFGTLAHLAGAPRPRLHLPGDAAMALSSGVERVWARLAPRTPPPLSRYLAYVVRRDVHFSLAHAERELGYHPRWRWPEALERTLAEMGALRRREQR
ncbi:NAD-dependent epimerase/dehydratase family protein [Truepera radiovictrix]|uniref:NAD-dependent epimerase/dehydratase n=1 Tax=Truepera radiovictrix (strain DSM 17093 / CIP 108686 / LMG 22925 / RQ-24) TaxID=649638 RepID=D7CXS6_TRURR|nr:NAD-dependent epimerase/dehydratase family protein [Truepera radiovictrix]ADI14678.1 NAD-dependent epimerase/dehydratase [Truepera radiovictrix DSM 17093]WMT56772.1 NAD-dependent epimerase/dehydratase family protein [Truepera radiovictrix]